VILAAASLVTPAHVFAQSEATPLSELLPTLHRRVIAAEDVLFSRSDPDAIKKNSLDTVLHINNLLAAQLSSFPLGSSAGGFTSTFEPVTGTFSRASDSFGPIFAERALTIARKEVECRRQLPTRHLRPSRWEGTHWR
jgi:hypothetical protein